MLKNQDDSSAIKSLDNSAKCQSKLLAMETLFERTYVRSCPLDPESIERFCQVWAEVGRAIILRRNQRK
jgi:hypothetical protein